MSRQRQIKIVSRTKNQSKGAWLSSSSYHKCPAPSCPISVPDDQLACRLHWFQLPEDLRDRINAAWRRKDRAAHRVALDEALSFYRGTEYPTT